MVGKISTLLEELRDRASGKTVILGIGNPLKRDDGIGPRLIERLDGRIAVSTINCGSTPENYTGSIRNKKPSTVVMVDAVDLRAKPGATRLLKPADVANETFTTHSVSLRTFSDFIASETGAEILILAIQPASVSFGTELSCEAEGAIKALEKGLLEVFGSRAS
jgi:hydrogenase 3 maturation protease